MRIGGKNINDECQYCGEMLQCELFRQGHGIKQQRRNITQMLECQIAHMEERKNGAVKGNN